MKNIILTFGMLFCINLITTAQNPTVQRGHNQFEWFVEVYHKESKRPVTDAIVHLYEMPEHRLIEYTYTNQKGIARFQIEHDKEYMIETCKRLYLNGFAELQNCNAAGGIFCIEGFSTFTYLAAGGSDKPYANLHASIEIDSIVAGKTFTLDNIYYDLDKWFIRADAKPELDKLVRTLRQHPSITIELGSHTDARGSDQYNETLSQKRANSCVEYLVNNGIAADRIVAKGYGENVLLNNCNDGMVCAENEHQKNRRTEFKILSFEGEECEIPTLDGDPLTAN